MNKSSKFEKSTGNVFEDLELPDAKERLFKAEIAESIHDIIKDRGLDQKSAAAILGIDQPKISALVNGRLSGFTIDRLFRFLLALNLNIEVKLTYKRGSNARGELKLFPNIDKRSAARGAT